jgi:hypothetical protein
MSGYSKRFWGSDSRRAIRRSGDGVAVSQSDSSRRPWSSVLSHRTILVCAGLVVVLAVVSGWLLLALYGGGTGQDTARLEVIRTVGTIVLLSRK